jgi:hypothetical protein
MATGLPVLTLPDVRLCVPLIPRETLDAALKAGLRRFLANTIARNIAL